MVLSFSPHPLLYIAGARTTAMTQAPDKTLDRDSQDAKKLKTSNTITSWQEKDTQRLPSLLNITEPAMTQSESESRSPAPRLEFIPLVYNGRSLEMMREGDKGTWDYELLKTQLTSGASLTK